MPLHNLRRTFLLGLLAFTAAVSTPANARRIGDPPATITEIPLVTRVSMPLQMGFDDQSNLWVGAFHDGKILRFTYNGETQVYDVAGQAIAPARGPMNMWVDKLDGSVWFSAIPGKIIHMLVDGTMTVYDVPSPRSMPMGISGDSQGNIWFNEIFNNKIGVIRPSGKIEEFKIPEVFSMPAGLTVDRNDNKWFAMTRPGKIGVLRTDGSFNFYNLPPRAHPMGIHYSEHQKTDLVWFTDTVGNTIGSITLDGKITLYRIPTKAAIPMMIMEDDMGQVWFTEFAGNQIGMLGLDGKIKEYKVPTPMSGPMGMDINPGDQSIWFSEVLRNKVGRLQNPSLPTTPPAPPMPMILNSSVNTP